MEGRELDYRPLSLTLSVGKVLLESVVKEEITNHLGKLDEM